MDSGSGRVGLRREWLSVSVSKVLRAIRSITLPLVAMKSHVRLVLLHKGYVSMCNSDIKLPRISRPCFLYICLCVRSNKHSGVNMREYSYFNDERVTVSKMSYRDFTQAFVDKSLDPVTKSNINVQYEAQFVSVACYSYPLSLKHLLDVIPLHSPQDCVLLSEGNMVYVKSRPNLMSKGPEGDSSYEPTEHNCLQAQIGSSHLHSDNCSMTLESMCGSQHSKLLESITGTLPINKVAEVTKKHVFSFPSREMHYSQILKWIRHKRIGHNTIGSTQHTIIEGFMDESKYEFLNSTLEVNCCYTNGDSEVYRLAGDKVLQIVVHSSRDREYLESTVLGIYDELDHNIKDSYPDPLELEAANIAKLRSTNSTVFDSLYCRKAPPAVQPLIIKESQIESSLAMGKMILRYEGVLYTTRDPKLSKGQNYVGMINRFGDYDPTKPYVPIIRTYKTNHLLSKSFKEFKAYLLRHSSHPNIGFISRQDLILPRSLEHLYRMPLCNPDPKVISIHSKKTIIPNSNKVHTGEVPDSIKALLGVSSARRKIESNRGTGLLATCGIDEEALLAHTLANRAKYLDLVSLTEEDIRSDVMSANVDHRVYGKAIEDLIGMCLIVFSMDGVVPYRYSKCEADDYLLLFRTNAGTYDRILVNVHQTVKYNMGYLKEVVNSSLTRHAEVLETRPQRMVDYTFVYLRLLGYMCNKSKQLGLRVSYALVSEARLEEIVEAVYSKPIYYEGYVSSVRANFAQEGVTTRGRQHCTDVTVDLLLDTLGPMVSKLEGQRVVVFSPVRMESYSPWNFLLEDCLYFSPYCYKVGDKEEVTHSIKGQES